MMFIPRSALALASLCADSQSRYALDGVLIQADEAGWRLVTTDGRALAILRGPSTPASSDLDAASGLPAPETLALRAVVPAEQFRKALEAVPKPRPHQRERKAGVLIGGDEVVFVAGNAVFRTAPVGGRFPDHEAVLPKGAAPVGVCLNPQYLIDLCRTAIAVSKGGPAEGQVWLLWWGKDRPVALTAQGKDGVALDALLMPISSDPPRPA
jgi:DNA polymerase III sliding clamp (beta) subunit (PCNA family)